MTNDPPDLSRPCPHCTEGFLLPDAGVCPNPECQAFRAPILSVPQPQGSRWLDAPVSVDTVVPETRYRASRAGTGQYQVVWAWRRE